MDCCDDLKISNGSGIISEICDGGKVEKDFYRNGIIRG